MRTITALHTLHDGQGVTNLRHHEVEAYLPVSLYKAMLAAAAADHRKQGVKQ